MRLKHMRKAGSEIEVYTVRNAAGQFLGTYRANSAVQAIRRHKDGQAAYFSTFRGAFKDCGYSAKVEGTR